MYVVGSSPGTSVAPLSAGLVGPGVSRAGAPGLEAEFEMRRAWFSASFSDARGNAGVQAWVAQEGVSLGFRAAGETLVSCCWAVWSSLSEALSAAEPGHLGRPSS